MAEIIFLQETESTNADIKALAREGRSEGTTVIARRQTRGRGRLGKSFFSPEGGLYMSTLLRPDYTAADSLLITTAAAAAVSRAIEDIFDVTTQIKWVNDIYINDKKVCGILAEAAMSGSSTEFAVLGIGINLYSTSPLPDDIKNIAGFVCDKPCDDGTIKRLATTILEYFYEYYSSLCEKPFLEYYKQKQLLKNRNITVLREKEQKAAIALGVDDDLRLRISCDGHEEHLSFGEVSIRL